EIDPAAVDRAAGLVLEMLRKGRAAHDENADYDAEAHHRIALEAARRAIVLLTNNGILPLPEERAEATDRPLAVIGDFAATPRYQGAGSSHVNPTRLTTALEAIRGIAGEVPFARGFAAGGAEDDDALRAEAGQLARAAGTVVRPLGRAGAADGADDADALRAAAVDLARAAATVVLFLGLGEDVESEGYDRTDMELRAAQERLLEDALAVNDRVVVVLSNGSAIRL